MFTQEVGCPADHGEPGKKRKAVDEDPDSSSSSEGTDIKEKLFEDAAMLLTRMSSTGLYNQ